MAKSADSALGIVAQQLISRDGISLDGLVVGFGFSRSVIDPVKGTKLYDLRLVKAMVAEDFYSVEVRYPQDK